MNIPSVWSEECSGIITSALKNEAARWFQIHQLPSDPAEWLALKPGLREKIWKAMRAQPVRNVDLDYRETGSIAMDGYSVKNIYFQSRKNFYITGNLYVPNGAGPFPAVLNLHGHWSQGRLAERVQSRSHTLAKNGYVSLAIDAFGSGERSTVHGQFEYHGEMLGASLWNLGESLMGIQLQDNMRAIDLLASFHFVCADRIGVTGASGGGNQTMWLAAMDDRIASSVPVASVGTFESYVGGSNCVCETLPDGLIFLEESFVLALAAPHAMKICSCLGEIYGAFFPKEMLRSFRDARKIYQALGADEKFAYQIFNHPHGYWPEMREAMLGWFDLHLRGLGHGAPKAEAPFRCLPERDLMVFPEGQRDGRVVSIAEYCRQKGGDLQKSSSKSVVDRGQKARELREVLRIGEALEKKALHRLPDSPDGWQRWTVETRCGRLIPLLIKPPAGGTDFYLMAGPTGKHDLAATTLLGEALPSGAGVALIDLWGTGETEDFDTACASVYHDLSRSCLWLGKTLLGEWTRDFSLIDSILREDFHSVRTTLGGHKEAGLAALFAAVLSDQKTPVILQDSPRTFLFHEQAARSEPRTSFYSMALHVPGILEWGDIPLAVSLAGGAVRFINPRRSDGAIDKQSTT